MNLLKFVIPLLLLSFNLSAQQGSEELLNLAKFQIDEGRYGEAIDLLNRYISANPQNAVGYNLRGICFEQRKEYEKSVYDFRSALKLNPSSKKYSENLNRNIKNQEAILKNNIVGYKREIAINPAIPDNYLQIGKCYKNLGSWQEAESWYDEYLKREEPSADELIRYSEILAKNNHIKKGEPWLKKYTERYPDDHRLWSRYGYFTMWLGKKKTAIKAFENALQLRPFFKEALDGYDLARGKGYVYTVNDTTARYNYGLPVQRRRYQYPIDRYYRTLQKNPADNNTRFKLAEELIKNNRFEEAAEQINQLSVKAADKERLNKLQNKFDNEKNDYYSVKIFELENKYSKNPGDESLAIKLADSYSQIGMLDKSVSVSEGFLKRNPSSENVKYKLAQQNLWNKNLIAAYKQSNELLESSPNNYDYLLLSSQTLLWLNTELGRAENQLQKILTNQPNNIEAITALAQLNLQKNNFTSAEGYINQIKRLKPGSTVLFDLEKNLHAEKKISEEKEKYQLLEKAREQAFYKQCDDAINYYQQYIKVTRADKNILNELANAYICKEDYKSALQIYDDILIEYPDDYQTLKQRAKIYYWSKDYYSAMQSFQKLNTVNPEDAEATLFLGDAYFALKQYDEARNIYNQLLGISPSSYIVRQRLNWLGGTGSFGLFPTYVMLVPEVNYFTDNFDFLYSTYGLRFDIGISNNVTLGVSAYGGVLGNDTISNNISIYKGSIITRFSEIVSASAAAGATIFSAGESRFTGEFSVTAQKINWYKFAVSFYTMDAAQILYSPFLVNRRLYSNYLLIDGNYKTKDDWIFSGAYSFITVSDENKANRLQLRLGKLFNKVLGVGYEYYYFDFKDQTIFYWSPKNFESHSIWADWTIVDDENSTAKIGGKLGYIPQDDFFLREFYGTATFKLTNNLSLQGRLTFGTTIQAGRGYSSTSFGASLFWAL